MQSDWEKIQGFDRTKREYIRLDTESWLASHRIRAEGEKRGKQNQPGTEETLPDGMYNKIETWVRKRALDCKEEVGRYIRDELANLHDLRSHWEKENPVIALDALVTHSCQNLDTTAAQSVGALDKQRAEFEEAARDLNRFRQDYLLSRVADYPSSQIAHWLWVPVFMIVETFIGANLLGSVSRGGVIEGWMVAAVLTFVNVLLGVAAGRTWRFTHLGWGFVKLFCYTLSVLFTGIALLWNDIAGHVRDVYVHAENAGVLEAPDEAFAIAWRTMMERPLPWESLHSAGLALVGIFVFFFTTYKSYSADDRFPGYGEKHRKAESLRNRYQDALNDALAELKSARDQANVAIEEIKDRHEVDRAGWQAALDRLHMVVDDYPMNLRQYNRDLAYLLAAYRDANLALRTTSPPRFFNVEPTIDEEALHAPEFLVPDPPEWGDISKKAAAGYERVGEAYERLRNRFQMLDRVVDDYAEKAS